MVQQAIGICLWFDSEAEEAAKFYTSVFPNATIDRYTYFGKEGFEHHQKPEGSIMTIDFQLNGIKFTALNGGPIFKFNESVSVVVNCDTQDEIDDYWNKLVQGGEEGPCGWLKDKFGLWWQITPRILTDYLANGTPECRARVERELYSMKKIDMKTLEKAFVGVD